MTPSESPTRKDQNDALNILLFSVGISNFDRFAIGPMLVLLAGSFEKPVSTIAIVATSHFIAYGLGQLFWGVVSDRIGRIIVARIALIGTAVGCLLSVVAPSVTTLAAARAMTGLFCGAIIPATITYIGDTVPIENRQKKLADMLAVMAVGSALATGLAGVIAEYGSWQIVFLLTAFLAALTVFRFQGSKNPPHDTRTDQSPFATLALVLRSGWIRIVMALALIEGALVMGLFVFLPTAIEQQGLSAGTAGSIAMLYGISVLIVSRSIRFLTKNPLLPMAIGGSCLILSFAMPAIFSGTFPLACTAALLGATWALFHSSLQTWMTTIIPQARATAVAAMTTALFLGSGLGTGLGGLFAETGNFAVLFTIAAFISITLVVATVILRSRYDVKQ